MNSPAGPNEHHAHSVEEALGLLDTRETGLSQDEAHERLHHFGPNEIRQADIPTLPKIIFSQFADFMIVVLLVAAFVAALAGEVGDSILIAVIVLLNGIIGVVQQYRAEQALAALRKLAAPQARVVRENQVQTIAADMLVPGDIVVLEAGDVVAADVRLISVTQLNVDESLLTGESVPVSKSPDTLQQSALPLGDRLNMAFRGTQITSGHGRGLVVGTGMSTELGRIASLLQSEVSGKTPLQIRLTRLGRRLAIAILMICTVVFVAGLLRGEEVMLMLLTAISLAVAAIPEALPAVITVALAFGASRMVKRQALIRRLPAVETLGSVTYICTDKTGTLTRNKMAAEWVYAAQWENIAALSRSPILLEAMALNHDCTLKSSGTVSGDPTEVALYEAALSAGMDVEARNKQMPRVAELPFKAERKRMTTFHQKDDGLVAYTKGAPETLVPLCAGMDDVQRAAILEQAELKAGEGYRMLAYAQRRLDHLPDDRMSVDGVEKDMEFLGLIAIIDPPRPEAEQAVKDCMQAGITPVMITGDHPGTAMAIARRLGIARDDDTAITGVALEKMSDNELMQRVETTAVYARVNPQQKIRIVKALQSQGEFVAMTGDGVNDAPALKRADIGVAMGQQGTEVAREAADMVLLDDNFATIVTAVREGRHIFDNIRKFARYALTTNSGEILVLLLAPFLGMPLPLLPVHILWINLVTDGLPGLALTTEEEEAGIMRRPPRPPDENILAHGLWQHIIWVGALISVITLGVQGWALLNNIDHWQTMVFTVLTFCQLSHVMAIRSERLSLFAQGLGGNKWLLAAVASAIVMQLAVIYTPTMNSLFDTRPLSGEELAICILASVIVFVAVEIEKWIFRRGWIYRETA